MELLAYLLCLYAELYTYTVIVEAYTEVTTSNNTITATFSPVDLHSERIGMVTLSTYNNSSSGYTLMSEGDLFLSHSRYNSNDPSSYINISISVDRGNGPTLVNERLLLSHNSLSEIEQTLSMILDSDHDGSILYSGAYTGSLVVVWRAT